MPIAQLAHLRPSALQSQYMRLFASMLLVLVTASLLPAQQTAAPDAAAIPASSQSTTPPAEQQPSAGSTGEVSTAPPGTPILPMVTPREAAEAKRQFQAGVKLKSK